MSGSWCFKKVRDIKCQPRLRAVHEHTPLLDRASAQARLANKDPFRPIVEPQGSRPPRTNLSSGTQVAGS